MRLCTAKRVLRNGNCELIENYLGHIQIFLGILYYLFVCVIFFFFIFLRSHSDYYFNCKWFDFFSAFLHCWYCCRFCFYFIFFRFWDEVEIEAMHIEFEAQASLIFLSADNLVSCCSFRLYFEMKKKANEKKITHKMKLKTLMK